MRIRQALIAKEKDLDRIQDLLALNCIFTQEFLSEHFDDTIVSSVFDVQLPDESVEDTAYVVKVAKMAKKSQDPKKFCEDLKKVPSDGIIDILPHIMNRWTDTGALWTHRKRVQEG
ncbi:hypothetical protein BGX31_006583, partial [Mortierella sp. GBA43]